MLRRLGGRAFRGLRAARSAYREADALLNSVDLPEDRVRRRLPLYIHSTSWQVRNVAVKLIARLRDTSFYPFLVRKLRNGSDVGIVTRNIITVIRQLKLNRPEVEHGLRRALRARYWEVRREAVRALSELFEPSPERVALLAGVLRPERGYLTPGCFGERNFEVRAAVARALGRCASPEAALPVLTALSDDANWLVRHQAAVALVELSCREPAAAPEAAAILDRMDVLSDGCQSSFPFPRTVASLRLVILNGLSDTDLAAVRSHYINIRRGWNRVKSDEMTRSSGPGAL